MVKPVLLTVGPTAGKQKPSRGRAVAAAVGRVDKDEASRRKTGGPFQSNGNGYGAQRRRRRIGEEGRSGVETPRSEREVANGRKTGHTVTKNLIKTAGAARLQGCMNQNQTLAHCIQNEPSSLVESSPAERGSPHTHQMHQMHTHRHTPTQNQAEDLTREASTACNRIVPYNYSTTTCYVCLTHQSSSACHCCRVLRCPTGASQHPSKMGPQARPGLHKSTKQSTGTVRPPLHAHCTLNLSVTTSAVGLI